MHALALKAAFDVHQQGLQELMEKSGICADIDRLVEEISSVSSETDFERMQDIVRKAKGTHSTAFFFMHRPFNSLPEDYEQKLENALDCLRNIIREYQSHNDDGADDEANEEKSEHVRFVQEMLDGIERKYLLIKAQRTDNKKEMHALLRA